VEFLATSAVSLNDITADYRQWVGLTLSWTVR